MEQSESTAGTLAASPVVRQLDFTGNSANQNGNSILLEHPQAQLESSLRALAQANQAHVSAGSRSPPPRFPAQTKTRESPESQKTNNLEKNDLTPKRKKHCNCKNSRCLKLYCECFASQTYCDGCNCMNCHNKLEFDVHRKEAMAAILERRPDAFRPKIASSPIGASDRAVEQHNKGCHCKKSTCLKKYCECYQANILCSEKCRCLDCKNYEGSEERKTHFLHHRPSHSLSSILQPKPVNQNGFPASNPSVSVLPKCSYRSPLTGILREEHIKDFCNSLVEASVRSATKNLSDSLFFMSGAEGKERNTTTTTATPCFPLSPVTLSLMCDEHDDGALAEDDPGARRPSGKVDSAPGNDVGIEQERRVLSKFCGFLSDLITRGYVRGNE
ncbi:hypothetical protein M569_09757, partial [Genlisea aurea]